MAKKDEYDYCLAWIKESREARSKQNALVSRAINAYQGKPSANRYANKLTQYATEVRQEDPDRAKQIEAMKNDIPDKGSMVVHNAIEALVSMAQGGIGQYEFGPYDPDVNKDNTLTDLMESAAKHWYLEEKFDGVAPRWIRAAALSGESYLHLNRRNGRTTSTILDSSQMLTDPKRFRLNYERYIGHEQRESWREIKSKVIKNKDGYKLKTINEVDVYISQVRDQINSILNGTQQTSVENQNLKADLDIFYKNIIEDCKERKKKDKDYVYAGDDIELAYLYDVVNDMEFQVVNGRYIIEAKTKRLSKTIKCTYTDSKGKEQKKNKTVKLDHPYVRLPFMETYWSRYPITPLFYVLDDFDDVCAMESVLYHNLSIMAPITFVGQSSDTIKVSRISSVAGEVVEGLPQTFGTLAKTHDITAVITSIQRYEERIKRTLKAVDPFELQSMIGDRASAKEVVAVSGSISQGLNPFIANIETAFAQLGEKFFKMLIIYDDDDVYSFSHNGEYAELTKEQMAGDYEIRAKLKTSIKLEQEANARRATELIQFLSGNEAIDKQQFLGTMIPIALNGLVNNEQAKAMVLPEYRPLPEEVVARIRENEEQRAKRDDIDKLNLDDMTPDELLAATAEASTVAGGGEFNVPMDPGMMPGQPQAMLPPMEERDLGVGVLPQDGAIPPVGAPEAAGELYNDASGLGLTL